MNNLIDINQRLDKNRENRQLEDGVCHSKNYGAVQFIGDEYPLDVDVHIEVYRSGGYVGTGLNICFGGESRLIELTEAEAVKLAEDILSAT